MSLTTRSIFYYGFDSASDNNLLNFNEGSGELTATIDISSYSLTEYLEKVKNALDTAGTQVYSVSIDRDTRLVTISATSNFDLLVSSGSNVGNDPFSLLGFTGADRTGTNSYTGDTAIGTVYEPQFILQDHIASGNSQQSIDATVNRSANGIVEVIRFGVEKFVQFNIKFITDLAQDGSCILTNNSSAVSEAQAFMQHITQKKPIEFMPDKSNRATFEELLLESTSNSPTGTGYELREQYNNGLPGYFDTGIMKFRVI
jgi:hypothetical protein